MIHPISIKVHGGPFNWIIDPNVIKNQLIYIDNIDETKVWNIIQFIKSNNKSY